jgi:hypothetical protein
VNLRLNEGSKDQWIATLKSLDHEDESLWRMTKRLMTVPTPSPPLVNVLPDAEKAETLAYSLETQFQLVTDPSVSLRSYFMTPAIEPKLTNLEEVQEAIRSLKISKAPGPNGIPNEP